MRILVTNDDGIHHHGLWALAEALKEVGRVSVVAPDRDMSGIGTALTLVAVVRAQEVASPVADVKAFSVQGTPSDCVVLASEALFGEPFDLLVSGINEGANLGLDILTSGTVGGALHGYYRTIPSMAISAVYSKETEARYDTAARTAVALAPAMASALNSTPLLNVNLPDVEPDRIQGVETTRLGPRAYTEHVERGQDGRRTHYWIRHNRPVEDNPRRGYRRLGHPK